MPSTLAITFWITMAAISALVRWSWDRLTSEASVLLDVADEMDQSYAESDLGDWTDHVPRSQANVASTSKSSQTASAKVSDSIVACSTQLGEAVYEFPPISSSQSKDEVAAWLQRVNRAEGRPLEGSRRNSNKPVFFLHSAEDVAPDAAQLPSTPQRNGRRGSGTVASNGLLSPLAISPGFNLHARSANNSRRCSWDADLDFACGGHRSMPTSPVA